MVSRGFKVCTPRVLTEHVQVAESSILTLKTPLESAGHLCLGICDNALLPSLSRNACICSGSDGDCFPCGSSRTETTDHTETARSQPRPLAAAAVARADGYRRATRHDVRTTHSCTIVSHAEPQLSLHAAPCVKAACSSQKRSNKERASLHQARGDRMQTQPLTGVLIDAFSSRSVRCTNRISYSLLHTDHA